MNNQETNIKVIPVETISNLSYQERRLVNYLVGKKSFKGTCFIDRKDKDNRYYALRTLVCKNLIKMSKSGKNTVSFSLIKKYSKQVKFGIITGEYFKDDI
jgi:hypothetical protein